MGVGKTTVGKLLKNKLDRAVFLDGDWCWDAHPFQVTPETKTMVMENIAFLLNRFLACSAYENVIFCWVMHEQGIVDDLLSRLERGDYQVKSISLICCPEVLRERLEKDIAAGIRCHGIVEKSLSYLAAYERLDTVKLDVSGLTPAQTVQKITDIGTSGIQEES